MRFTLQNYGVVGNHNDAIVSGSWHNKLWVDIFVFINFLARPFQTTLRPPFTAGSFTSISVEVQRSRKRPEVVAAPQVKEQQLSVGLFQCTNEGCIKVYQSHSALEKHVLYEKCELREERSTLLDQSKMLYQHKLLEGSSTTETVESLSGDSSPSPLTKGWALKTTKSSRRFNDVQKKYLDDKFRIGQQTGHKLDPATVARDMRYAKKSDGARLCHPEEFLTAAQIQSYFSRQAAALRHHHDADSDDEVAATEELNYTTTRAHVVREMGLKHPVTYNQYNLCEMLQSKKLNKLSVSMLQDICTHFDINTESVTAHRKSPYIALLTEMIQECSCNKEI